MQSAIVREQTPEEREYARYLTEVEAPENPNFRSRNHSEDRENRPG